MKKTFITIFTLTLHLWFPGGRMEVMAMNSDDTKTEKATFAGGCFWCMEHPFEKIDGVVDVVSGYTGGETSDPTYKKVSSGKTGHLEAVQAVAGR